MRNSKRTMSFIILLAMAAAVIVIAVSIFSTQTSDNDGYSLNVTEPVKTPEPESTPEPVLTPKPTSTPTSTPSPTPTPIPDTIFTPLTPKDPNALIFAIDRAGVMRAEIDYEMSLLTETTHSSWFVSDFRNANDCYKAGEFNEALERYEKILNSCPTHLGARNNYILTLVHLEQFEEALHNSMLLELMNPGYEGNQVNMLIPLYALGFNEEDLRHAWSDAGLPALGGISDDSILRAYLYNRIYANMEKDMDESAVETNLAAMEDELTYLLEADPTDTDIIELLDYLEGLKKIRKNNEPR